MSGTKDRSEIARALDTIAPRLLLVRQNIEHGRWELAAQLAADVEYAASKLEAALGRMAMFGDLE